MKNILRMAVVATALCSMYAIAEEVPANGAGFNRLRMRVVVNFPPDVTTVGESARYLLEPTDYKLATLPDLHASQILTRPLAPQARSNMLQTIEDALLLLSGDDTRLLVDHEHKLVAFEPM
jgi:hypothetical protein